MTLLAAVITDAAILVAADTKEVRSAQSELSGDVQTQTDVTKFKQSGSEPVMWGFAGGTTLSTHLEPVIASHGLSTVELVLEAHHGLLRLKKQCVTDGFQDHDPGLDTRMMFAGYWSGVPKIYVSYSSGAMNSTDQPGDVMFLGSGESATRLALGILQELHPGTDLSLPTGLRSFMQACIARNNELGGTAQVWTISPAGIVTLES